MAGSDNEFETRVNEAINAVKKGDLSTVKTLVEGDRRLAVAQRQDGGGSLIQIAASQVVWHRPQHRKIVQYLAENGTECDILPPLAAARAQISVCWTRCAACSGRTQISSIPEIIAVTRRCSAHLSSTALVKKLKPLWIIC